MARGRRIEDHHVERAPILGWDVQEIGETIEGGYFRGAGPAHLLLDDLHHLRRKRCPNRRQSAIPVFLGGPVRVDFHRPQTGHTGNGRDLVSDGLLEDVRQVGGWIGGDDQCALAFIREAHRSGAGHAGFAHAALAGEEDELGGHDAAPFNAALTSAMLG